MRFLLSLFLLVLVYVIPAVHAEEKPLFLNHNITLKVGFEEKIIRPKTIPNLVHTYQKYYFRDMEVLLPEPDLCTEEKTPYDYVEKREVLGINRGALQEFIDTEIAPQFFEEKKDVVIRKENDQIVFDTNGRNGRKVDTEKLVFLLKKALETGETVIQLPMESIPAMVTVEDEELKNLGISEIVSTGVSDFRGSPANRIHNIKRGLSQFQGAIVPARTVFSTGNQLGVVDKSTGYLPELVIKGDKTLPEYGGGLCQVSTTLFRGVLNAGFPVTERRNHSYSVSYYNPPGTDATIYPPSIDFRFENDTDAALLIQTYIEGTKAYFTMYGTSPKRNVEMFGPYISNWQEAPAPKIEYTSLLSPGEKKKVGEAHAGFNSRLYRFVYNSGGEKTIEETFLSRYQTRPLYYLVGNAEATSEPSLN